MPERTIEIRGLAEVDAALKRIADDVRYRIIGEAAVAGAEVLAKSMAERTRSHQLRHGIEVGKPVVANGLATVSVGPRKGIDRLGTWEEYGVKAHDIPKGRRRKAKPGRKRVLLVTQDHQVLGPKVKHPGAPAHPFMRPALDETGRAAAEAMRAKLRQGIEALAVRLPKVSVNG